jgi:hypothetical protein
MRRDNLGAMLNEILDELLEFSDHRAAFGSTLLTRTGFAAAYGGTG